MLYRRVVVIGGSAISVIEGVEHLGVPATEHAHAQYPHWTRSLWQNPYLACRPPAVSSIPVPCPLSLRCVPMSHQMFC